MSSRPGEEARPMGDRVRTGTAARWAELAATLLALVVFAWTPFAPVKLACLWFALWLGIKPMGAWGQWLGWVLLSTLAYGAAFLLTPLCVLPSLQPKGLDAELAAWLWQGALVVFGWLWLGCALGPTGPLVAQRRCPAGAVVAVWLVLLVVWHWRAWGADVSYGGDEHYHMAAAARNAVLGRILLAHGVTVALLVLWLMGLWLVRRWPGEGSKASGVLLWAGAGLLVLAMVSSLTHAAVASLPPAIQTRALRYPGALAWLSGWIGLMDLRSWEAPIPFAVLRMVPMLALGWLGLLLAGEARWRRVPWPLTGLALTTVVSVPTLHYHGTMLYLELAMVPLLLLVLQDSRRWCCASPRWLAQRPCWWGALLLGFMKDTGIVAAALLLGARLAWQGLRCWRRRRRWPEPCRFPPPGGSRWRGELALFFAVMGPGLLYLALRSAHGIRPYGLHLGNVLDLALWSQAGTSLLLQFGAIWLPALAAALWWWRARRWFALGLAVVVGGGMAAFHFFEDPQWIGFARFNLLVLPPVLWLAWEGLGRWMARAPRYAALASVVLVILNWLLSPVDLSGGRAAWGNSPERWYDFTACLRDVGQRAPEARVLLGNFEYSYALLQVADRLGWRPPWTGESPPVRGVPPEAALERTLRQAAARGADWVIYRSEEDLELAPGRIIAGYQKQRDYPARAGRLTLFRQVAPPLTP